MNSYNPKKNSYSRSRSILNPDEVSILYQKNSYFSTRLKKNMVLAQCVDQYWIDNSIDPIYYK